MPYYFAGGEDHDFSRIGGVTVDTATTAARRTANARCSLKVPSSVASDTDGWQAALSTTITSAWFTARCYLTATSGGFSHFVAFLDGTVRRLVLTTDGGAPGKLRLVKRNAAGTNTTLATASVFISSSAVLKFDIQISSYGAAGTVNVYQDGTLLITYTGDLTTDGSTSLSGFVVGTVYAGVITTYWSEIICTSDDTRGLSLVTLPPAANGNAFAWSNSYANLDEVTLDDTDLCTSAAANDILEATVTSSGITGNPAIRAVCVSARAQKGGTGPQNIQAMVRTGGNDYVSGTIALPPAFNRVANIWETNPATSGAWAYTDLTAAGFNIGVKSIT